MTSQHTGLILQVNGHDVEVLRKKVIRLRLTLYSSGTIRLSAPKDASDKEIQAFLDSKAAWLEKNLARLAKNQSGPMPFTLAEKHIFLWGEKYKLVPHEQGRGAYINKHEKTVELFMPDASCGPGFYIVQFYARETENKAAPILDLWTKRMKLGAVHCSVRAMKSRWGSCTPNAGRIRLNAWLASRGPECLEYVIVHELCHFFERKHGAGFYKLMVNFLPDWESRRHILEQGN